MRNVPPPAQSVPAPRRTLDLVSPRAHAIIDRLCLPVLLGCAVWAARRSKPAAAIILAHAVGEGTVGCITDFPTNIWPLISFRAHVRIGQVCGTSLLALSYLLPATPRAERNVAIFWGLVPIVLNGISDISGLPAKEPEPAIQEA
ncbi:hypothetical protein [Hymenobacter volaticus]|uniref:Uncharacterized protein n=1 Tax=Hymenobacter volaticus TaxID=2932254 RepID=A0ABY4GGB4_9BACT|nr:hypothetical protein [Hymenobacter volaticus]UOQ69848.1 hypothetical protein MUN86_30170 [Hymenobacter volaticus]